MILSAEPHVRAIEILRRQGLHSSSSLYKGCFNGKRGLRPPRFARLGMPPKRCELPLSFFLSKLSLSLCLCSFLLCFYPDSTLIRDLGIGDLEFADFNPEFFGKFWNFMFGVNGMQADGALLLLTRWWVVSGLF